MDGCHEFYRLYNMYICRRVSTSVQNSLLLLNVIKMNCIGCMSASHSWAHPHFLEGHDGSIHLCWRAQVAPTVRFGHAASPWCLGNAVPHKYSQIIAFWNARFNQIYKSAGPASGQWKRGIFCKPFAWLIPQTPEATWARARSIPPAASSGSCNFLMTMRHKIQLWCKQNQL